MSALRMLLPAAMLLAGFVWMAAPRAALAGSEATERARKFVAKHLAKTGKRNEE